MPVTKAVLPVAGMGTRLLPATKSQPKEMLPVGHKPVVQYVVEEMIDQGVGKFLFVTGRKKRSIEDHFDDDPELEERIDNKQDIGEVDYAGRGVDFYFVRQRRPKGNADAVRLAAEFVGDESFVMLSLFPGKALFLTLALALAGLLVGMATDLLVRLFHEEGPRVFDAQAVKFGCSCSPEKVRESLSIYSAKDIRHMTTDDNQVTADCQFCGAHYTFDPETLGFEAKMPVENDLA